VPHGLSPLTGRPRDQNSEIVSKYINEQEFQDVAFGELAKRIYEELRENP
jgi:hypothetical protein